MSLVKQVQFGPQAANGELLIRPLVGLGLEKTASAEVRSNLHPRIQDFVRAVRPTRHGIYILVNALGAGEYYSSNSNGDLFPEAALLHSPLDWDKLSQEQQRAAASNWRYGYPTFLNAYPYSHHQNKDPSRAFGSVELVTWNPIMHRVELVCYLDRERAKKFGSYAVIERIENGEYPSTSMGCRVPFDTCTLCEHRSKTEHDYCIHCHKQNHAPGFGLNRILPDGRKIAVRNDFPRFFDISFVFIGADKIAFVTAKLAHLNNQTCLGSFCSVPRTSAEVGAVFSKEAASSVFMKSDLQPHALESLKQLFGVPKKKPVLKSESTGDDSHPERNYQSVKLAEDTKNEQFVVKHSVPWHSGYTYTLASTKNGVAHILGDPKNVEEGPAAYLYLTPQSPAILRVDALFTHPNHRKKGLAKDLVTIARALHPKEHFVVHPDPFKDKSVGVGDLSHVYTSAGFHPVNDQPGHFIHPAATHSGPLPHISVSHEKTAGRVKRQTTFGGLTLKLEYDTGDYREGVNKATGEKWRKKMFASYGYIPKTTGEDGEAVDIYLRENPAEGSPVFVVHQVKKDRSPDEDKVMLGYPTQEEAVASYKKHVPEWCFGSAEKVSQEEFKAYLHDTAKTASYAEHAALNLGQAARDLRHFFSHPDATQAAPKGTVHHVAASAALRLPSLLNNVYFAALPPHLHHSKEDLHDLDHRERSLSEWFSRGYEPWKHQEDKKKTAGASCGKSACSCGCASQDDFDKLAELFVPQVKKAGHRKLSELIKEVPAGPFTEETLPKLEVNEESIPTDVLDKLSHKGLGPALATSGMMGIVLKPHEFQRIVLIRMGEKPLADTLDQLGSVFPPSKEVDKSIEVCPEKADDGLQQLLMSFLGGRCCAGPVIEERAMKATQQKEKKAAQFSACPVASPLMAKLAAAYNGYRSSLVKKATFIADHMVLDPELRSYLFEPGMAMAFASGFEKTSQASILSPESLAYLTGAHYEDRDFHQRSLAQSGLGAAF